MNLDLIPVTNSADTLRFCLPYMQILTSTKLTLPTPTPFLLLILFVLFFVCIPLPFSQILWTSQKAKSSSKTFLKGYKDKKLQYNSSLFVSQHLNILVASSLAMILAAHPLSFSKKFSTVPIELICYTHKL